MRKLINLFFIISLIFTSCCGLKVKSGTPDSNRAFESYFVDKGVFQYFVNPLKYTGKKSYLKPDITFRDSAKSESFIVMNFTIRGTIPPDSVIFLTEKPISLIDISLLYDDKINNTSRYTSKIRFSQFKEICKFPGTSILIKCQDNNTILTPAHKTKKKLAFVNKYLFQT